MKRLDPEAVKKWAMDHWGLRVYKADPNARGWWNGAWKTGWVLNGQFPGDRHRCVRYPTLRKLAKAIQFPGLIRNKP